MPKIKLNPRGVGNLKPRPGHDRDVWWDATNGAPAGFGVRVTADGSRSYCVTYRADGRFRWLTLGKVEDVSLVQARKLARAALTRVAGGQDPAAEKITRRRADTLADLVLAYIEDGTDERSAITTGNYRRQQRALAKTALGKLRAPAVTKAAVRDHVEAIAEDSPVQANRVLALIRATCRWAAGRDLIAADPTASIERPSSEAPRDRVLTDGEVIKVWTAVESQGVVVAAAVRLLLLLATRRTETLCMRWEDLNLTTDVPEWVIPGEYRKGGRSIAVPLSKTAVSIIESLRPVTGDSTFVLSGPRGAAIASNPARWTSAVRTATGVDFTLHDLRRTCATGCARLGASEAIVSRLLGHAAIGGTVKVSGIYDRYDRFTERASALNAWAAHVSRVVSGQERRAEVVAIR